MSVKHDSAYRVQGYTFTEGDSGLSYDQLNAGLLFNIRDVLDRIATCAERDSRALARIDRRLAAHFPITKRGTKYKRPVRK
jgi:hypothetical protein